jgi:C-terminal processing protease CtpA/Prc
MSRRLFLIAASVLISCALDAHAKQARSDSHCDVPGYFGICDPYVPGTIISFQEKQPIRVITTWHEGPAERAGVCPGDKIVALNGVLAAENTRNRMLHEIVSTTPSPVLLTVKRGDRTMEFRVRRVRESMLAKLSHQKFMSDPNFWGSEELVPHGEKRAEHARYTGFLKELEEREGFERIDGLAAPIGTPPRQVRRLKEFMSGGQEQSREAGYVGPTAGKYSFGFTALVLKDPSEALIEAVFPNSPAHRAGLLPGDRVLEVDGRDTSGMTFGSVKALILEPDQERTLSLKVDRGGQQTFQIRAEPFDQVAEADLRREMTGATHDFSPDDYVLGIGVLYSSDPREVMVSEVHWPSPAFDAGLHVGDAILAINGKPISGISREEFGKLLVPEGASPMTFEVSRLGRKKTFTVRPATYRSAEAGIGRKLTKSGSVPEGCPSS